MNSFLLNHLLEDAAAQHPERTAVVDGDRSIDYQTLERRANQVARLLVERGVRSGDRVGLYLEKSLESVVAIYGALKAGAAYVPLDPQAPVARLGYIGDNCGLRVLLTGRERSDRWCGLSRAVPSLEHIVCLNSADPAGDAQLVGGPKVLSSRDIDRQPTTRPDSRAIDLDLAYILYTSGSTGLPKGVMLSHQNALTFVKWGVGRFAITPDDRLSSHAPLHFDLSIFDLFAAAAAGAAVILVPPGASIFPVELARWIEQSRITVWYSVPSVLSMMTLRGNLTDESFPDMRALLFAGEVFPAKYLRRLMGLLPHVGFYNLYGPTETNVCTCFEVPPLPEGQTEPVSIGAAIDDVEVFAISADGRRAGVAEEGELYVRGSTVMVGYWGDSKRTSHVLVSNPLREDLRDLAYRTGDLVVQQEDGNYRFLGRRDTQVKSRGYRIELGEVEAALYAHPSVRECVVLAIPDELVTNRLVAYVSVDADLTTQDLVRFCSDRIPRYMIPETFGLMQDLPKTSTGKVDRQVLLTSVPARA